jgi:tRNA-specific 2-thiouridylase
VRDRLESIHGRSRSAQLELARRFGIPQQPSTGGGCCLLSDAGFSRRLKDHLGHEGTAWPGAEPLARLRLGRHFRLSHAIKVVVARNDDDGRELAAVASGSWVCRCVAGGALAVVEGSPGEEGLSRAAALAAHYGAGRDLPRAEVVCTLGSEERRVFVVPERDPGRFGV